MKKLLIYIFILSVSIPSYAQFYTQGKISFERKISVKRKLETESKDEWVKSNINRFAQFTASDFTLTFNKTQTEYDFVKEQEVTGETYSWGTEPGSQNAVFVDFKNGQIKSKKLAYEKTYLIEDSIPKFKWKIMDEMRTIAGFPCRKAITNIDDSVVVVAFYCDQLMVSGGPESFNGLPGMILGLAIPRLYATWFATNVDITPQELTPFKTDKKSKVSTQKLLMKDVENATKDWGDYSASFRWWILL